LKPPGRNWPAEDGAFLHDLQERFAIAINSLQVKLGMGFEGKEGLPETPLKIFELKGECFSKPPWFSTVDIYCLESSTRAG